MKKQKQMLQKLETELEKLDIKTLDKLARKELIDLLAKSYSNQEIIDIMGKSGVDLDDSTIEFYRKESKRAIQKAILKNHLEAKEEAIIQNEERKVRLSAFIRTMEEEGTHLEVDSRGRLQNADTYLSALKTLHSFDEAANVTTNNNYILAFQNFDVENIWSVEDGRNKKETQEKTLLQGEITDFIEGTVDENS